MPFGRLPDYIMENWPCHRSTVAADHRPRKHYAGVRMQQGRVLTDDDFNEAATIDAEELRRTRASRDRRLWRRRMLGFLPKDFAVVGGKLDFTLARQSLSRRPETGDDDRGALSAAKGLAEFRSGGRCASSARERAVAHRPGVDRGWQQPVTAVEDSELFEVALGGPGHHDALAHHAAGHVAHGVAES